MTEYVDIVTDKDRKNGKVLSREEAKKLGLMHRDVHVIIENSKGEILVVKRAERKGDRYSGYFDTAVGGHVRSGETYFDFILKTFDIVRG